MNTFAETVMALRFFGSGMGQPVYRRGVVEGDGPDGLALFVLSKDSFMAIGRWRVGASMVASPTWTLPRRWS